MLRRIYAVMLVACTMAVAQSAPRTIAILADHDSRYKIDGEANPTLTLKAGEQVKLVITAVKAKSQNRDGSVHGLVMVRGWDGNKVPGWDLLFKPGVQEFELQAPTEPGEYHVFCTVICSSKHEDMQMKVIVQE